MTSWRPCYLHRMESAIAASLGRTSKALKDFVFENCECDVDEEERKR